MVGTSDSRRARAGGALSVLLAAALILAGCRAADDDGAPLRPTRTLVPATETPAHTLVLPTPTPTDLPGPSSFVPARTPVDLPGLPGELDTALQRAVDDLVASGDAARDAIRVLSLQRFTWRDAALGCVTGGLEPGAPQRLDGYRILLAGPRAVYAYHTAGDALVRCAPGSLAAGLSGEALAPDPIAAAMMDLVRRDWAAENGVSADDVLVTSLLSVIWPDASVGCPKSAGFYPADETPGYRIVVRAGDAEAAYHTSIRSFVRCARSEEVLPDLIEAALATPPAPSTR